MEIVLTEIVGNTMVPKLHSWEDEDENSEIEFESARVFAKNMQSLMLNTGWSQQYLADQLGIKQSGAGKYLKGSIPRADILDKLCEVFGVTVEELFRSDSTPKPRIERSPLADELSNSVKSAVQQAFEHVDILKDQEIKNLKAENETLKKELDAFKASGAQPDELSLLCRQIPPKLRPTVRQVLERMVGDQAESRKRSNQG